MIEISMEQLIDLGRELFPSRTVQIGGKPKMTAEEFEELVHEFEVFTMTDDACAGARRAATPRAGVFWA